MKNQPKTLVKFYVEDTGSVMAYFPQLNYNKAIYGNSMKTCYAHIGQHSACHKEYIKGNRLQKSTVKTATKEQYNNLLTELNSIGYTSLKVLNYEN